MLIKAYAKINWTLDVLYKRLDGYHELDTLMQQISLCDDVTLSPAPSITVCVDGSISGVPSDSGNIAFRAAQAYLDYAHIDEGVSIHIVKRIPIEAGIGGGSADAAAVLRGLNTMYGAASEDGLQKLALSIGADVPFCLTGGAARCRGIGEQIEPLLPLAFALLLVKPMQGISTKSLFDSLALKALSTPCTGAAIAAYGSHDAKRLGHALGNDLTEPAAAQNGDIAVLLQMLLASGAGGASMSGSGSCCFGIYESLEAAQQALPLFNDWPFARVCTSFAG